jgi:intraflagellar transport protein 81
MDKISFIVDRLNQPPFSKELLTMSDLDSKSPYDLLDITCEVIIFIDSEMSILEKEDYEMKIQRIMSFLNVMKFGLPPEQVDNFISYLMAGDKETMYTIMHWCLSNLDRLQKRAYLARYLMPVEVPSEFLGDDNINDLIATVKELQAEFKVIHKNADQTRNSGMSPSVYKTEIDQLEQAKSQLNNKIQRLIKESEKHEPQFKQMLKVCYDIEYVNAVLY